MANHLHCGSNNLTPQCENAYYVSYETKILIDNHNFVNHLIF